MTPPPPFHCRRCAQRTNLWAECGYFSTGGEGPHTSWPMCEPCAKHFMQRVLQWLDKQPTRPN